MEIVAAFVTKVLCHSLCTHNAVHPSIFTQPVILACLLSPPTMFHCDILNALNRGHRIYIQGIRIVILWLCASLLCSRSVRRQISGVRLWSEQLRTCGKTQMALCSLIADTFSTVEQYWNAILLGKVEEAAASRTLSCLWQGKWENFCEQKQQG